MGWVEEWAGIDKKSVTLGSRVLPLRHLNKFEILIEFFEDSASASPVTRKTSPVFCLQPRRETGFFVMGERGLSPREP